MNTININSDVLSKAIQNIIGVVERKQTMPILSHILIEGKDESLTFTSTDLEVQLSTDIKLNKEERSFLTTAPGRKLYEIIRSLDNKELSISISGSDLTIESSSSKVSLGETISLIITSSFISSSSKLFRPAVSKITTS